MNDHHYARFQQQWAEMRKLSDAIMDELRQFNDLMRGKESTPFVCRLKVRVVSSLMEARLSHVKTSALTLAIDPEKVFTLEERLALQDERQIKGTTKGHTKVVPARLTMKQNVKLALSAFATALGFTYTVNFGDKAGVNFLKAMKIRDRVVHPKRAQDWQVSPEEVAMIDAAWDWLGQHMLALSLKAKEVQEKKLGH